MLTDVAEEAISGLAYGGAGIVLLILGYGVLDLVTPGNLRRLIYDERNKNAALVLASGLLAIATIVATAIFTSHDDFTQGLADTAGYGVLGVILLGVSFVILDKLTPGDLGVICTDREPHPAVYVTVATQLAIGLIVAAAIS